MKRVVDQSGARRADLAAIHVAKKALEWDDETYRDVMFTVVRHKSSAELDFAGRKRWLEHLRTCMAQQGLQPAREAPRRGKKAWTPRHHLLWSLWQRLADAKHISDRTLPALNAWVKRQTQVDSVDFLNVHQLDAVIDAAKRWLDR